MNLIYGIKDKPRLGQVVLFSIQQLLAIMAATIAVPAVVNSVTGSDMTASAALFGAGVGTIVYLLFTKSSSPVFLGSSFAFLGSMFSAFGGAASMQVGYAGLIIGALIAGLVYVIIAIIVKFCGVQWIDRLMPPVIIGPTVAIIGLSLAGNAVGDLMSSSVEGGSTYVALICGLVTLAVVMLCSTYAKRIGRLIPFIIGILAGYACASIFALIGKATGNPALTVINYSALTSMKTIVALPEFSFLKTDWSGLTGSYFLTIFVAYAPVAFVVFAEHLADHKNLSTIVGVNLLEEPGLTRTLLGDGIGSFVGAFFGGCPNTTYGLGRGHGLHHILSHHPAGGLPRDHTKLRYGRRVRHALRLHRRLRLQDAAARGPEQEPQPLRGLRHLHHRRRRHGRQLRTRGDPYRGLRSHPRHPHERHALQGGHRQERAPAAHQMILSAQKGRRKSNRRSFSIRFCDNHRDKGGTLFTERVVCDRIPPVIKYHS